MKALINYFEPTGEPIFFNQLKTKFFIRICLIGVLMLFIYLLSDLFFKNENFWISMGSKTFTIVFIASSLFVLKYKGIIVAGNIFTTTALITLLVFVNIIPENISPLFKFIQGFYSIFVYLVMGILFATRPFIIINFGLVMLTTTHVFLKAIAYFPAEKGIYTSSFINHTLSVVVITIIIYYANKFTHLAIQKAEEEIKIRENKNQELLASEEEIRASNEELVATTDALVATNEDLKVAIEKAEESDRLKSEFLNNMSHEVRTPMNGIIGFAQLLEDSELDRDTLNNYTTIIQQSSNQLLSIIDNIIEISKLGTKQVHVYDQKINLDDFLNELYAVFEITANNKNVGFKLDNKIDKEQSEIFVDGLKLYSILSNLLENAFKFTKKGKVVMACNLVDVSDNKYLSFIISDTGIGIKPDRQKMIFEKFRQADAEMSRQFGGLGLGLSIAKENTELLGGIITLESEFGKGSVFAINIPYKPVEVINS